VNASRTPEPNDTEFDMAQEDGADIKAAANHHVIEAPMASFAASALVLAAPLLLLRGPCLSPVVVGSVAILWWAGSRRWRCPSWRRRATLASMLAAPNFLPIRPSHLPIGKAGVAIVWQGCCRRWRRGSRLCRGCATWATSPCMGTAPSSFAS